MSDIGFFEYQKEYIFIVVALFVGLALPELILVTGPLRDRFRRAFNLRWSLSFLGLNCTLLVISYLLRGW